MGNRRDDLGADQEGEAMNWPAAREWIAFAIIGLFAYAFIQNPTEQLMVGAIIAAFSTAYGFYLGGSKTGSDTATKNADTVAEQARAAVSEGAPPPTKTEDL
jgi:hypothetical protein